MELQPNLSSINRRTQPADSAVVDRKEHERRVAHDLDAASRRATAMDARIGSLKILAQSLMRQIEFLEKEAERVAISSFDNAVTSNLDAQTEVRRFEAELIRSALIKTGGRQRRAARLLGMKATTLNTKIKRYGITLDNAANGYESKSEILPEQSLKVS